MVSGSKQASRHTHKDMCNAVSTSVGLTKAHPLTSYSCTVSYHAMTCIIYGVVMKFGGLTNRHPKKPIKWPIIVKYLGIFCRVKTQVQQWDDNPFFLPYTHLNKLPQSEAIEAVDKLNLPVCLLVSQKTKHPVYNLLLQQSRSDQYSPPSDETAIRNKSTSLWQPIFIMPSLWTHWFQYIRHTFQPWLAHTFLHSTQISTEGPSLKNWHQPHTFNNGTDCDLACSLPFAAFICWNLLWGNILESVRNLAT